MSVWLFIGLCCSHAYFLVKSVGSVFTVIKNTRSCCQSMLFLLTQVDVTKKNKEDFNSPPREGSYVHGLFMEGARWDTQTGMIAESRLKELTPAMPVMFIRAIPVDKQDMKNVYECPVYKTRQRGPTYVWNFFLKTKEPPARWTLAGVALLLSV